MSRPLRLEIVASVGPFGGAERFLLELLDNAAGRLEPSLVALGDAGLIASAQARGWPVSTLPSGPRARQVTTDVWRLARRWRRDRPDVVLANGVRAATAAVPAGCLSPARVVWMKHDFSHDGVLSRIIGRLTDGVVANSAAVAAATRRADAVIISPARPPDPLPVSDARARLAECGVPLDDTLVAITIGRLVPYKGVDDAIRAVAASDGWKLVVIGGEEDGAGERARLEQCARDARVEGRVHFLGDVPNAGRLLSAADAVLVTTKTDVRGRGREGYGIVADEAMRAGVPVVATRGGELTERAGAACIPVEPGAPAEIASALDRLRERSVRETMGRAGARQAETIPLVDEVASRFVAHLAAVAARPGAGLSAAPTMSVVVPVAADEPDINDVVTRLSAQLRDDELVLAIDANADDTTRAAADRAAANGATVISVPARCGPSAARNRGIDAAAHEIVACTDAGCVADPGWLDGLRVAFGEHRQPALVTGVYRVDAHSTMEHAFDVACYPDVGEVRAGGIGARLYGRLLGRRFEAGLPTGRSVAFLREVWKRVGGFEEGLRTAEDVTFGARIVGDGLPAVLTADAGVTWEQRPTLRETARMYYRYGVGDARSGNTRLIMRNFVRVLAYVGAPLLIIFGGWPAWIVVALAAAVYLSIPIARVRRRRLSPLVAVAVPFALAVKDIAKAAGCLRGFAGARSQ